ncbi:hypothetical protein AYI70_g8241 [Smittium culicis]|uniref:Uncharacterized protein n=1 Tax=Smittium culicis TaxID=133412 RepID=A0A1R1XGW2_9FUNG|nr:hypothetical protein AYI70_g8241 [Smittium culicis]
MPQPSSRLMKQLQVQLRRLAQHSTQFKLHCHIAWPESTKRLVTIVEEYEASPKRGSDGVATTKIALSAIQADAQPQGPTNPKVRGGESNNKKGYRGVRESKTSILQQFILYPKETKLPASCFEVCSATEPSYLHENYVPSFEIGTDP